MSLHSFINCQQCEDKKTIILIKPSYKQTLIINITVQNSMKTMTLSMKREKDMNRDKNAIPPSTEWNSKIIPSGLVWDGMNFCPSTTLMY